jgi:hypothetical protein
VLLTWLLITIAMFTALGTALYLAYRETEADLPLRHKPHRGVRTRPEGRASRVVVVNPMNAHRSTMHRVAYSHCTGVQYFN